MPMTLFYHAYHRGLNHMIQVCPSFVNNNYITFNCKKTAYIKFGGMAHDYEHVTLNGTNID